MVNFLAARQLNCACISQQKWGTNKKHRNIDVKLYFQEMANPQTEEVLAPLRANVKEQVGSECYTYVSNILLNSSTYTSYIWNLNLIVIHCYKI